MFRAHLIAVHPNIRTLLKSCRVVVPFCFHNKSDYKSKYTCRTLFSLNATI